MLHVHVSIDYQYAHSLHLFLFRCDKLQIHHHCLLLHGCQQLLGCLLEC